MKFNFRLVLAIVAFLFSAKNTGLFAQQQPHFCGTSPEKSAFLEKFQAHPEHFQHPQLGDTTWLYVPTTVHLVGTDAGSGYFSGAETFRALCELNEDFAPARIRFFLPAPFNYINNSAWYNHAEYGPGGEMMEQSNKPLSLNSYIVQNPAGNCGYYWGQYDGLALNKGCVGGGDNTWAHELGHNLSLPHPFRGWEGFNWDYSKPAPLETNWNEIEKTDGSNCQSAGDGFCDTKPDYLNYRWQCNSDGLSGQVQLDPDSVAFRSDGSLFMAYPNDACQSRFSPEQIEAMRADLLFDRWELLYTTAPTADLDENAVPQPIFPAFEQLVTRDSIYLEWSPVAGADFYTVRVGLWSAAGAVFYQSTVDAPATSHLVTRALPAGKFMRWSVSAYSKWDFCKADSIAYGKFLTSTTTAATTLERLVAAQVSPNPTAGGASAFFEIEAVENFEADVRVVDLAGKTVFFAPKQRVWEGENRIEIPTANFPAGIFQVILENEKGRLSRKLAVVD